VAKGIFVGLSTVDVVYRVDEFPRANSKIAARSQEIFAGGPATNASIAFSCLGGSSTLVATVGKHLMASAIVDEIGRYCIHLIDLNPDFDQPPAVSSVCVNGAGERNVVSANALRVVSANALRIGAPLAQIDEALLGEASVVLVDGHTMQAAMAWSRAARDRGIPAVLDGGSWKAGTDELLQCIDTAICSADFLPPGCRNEEDTIEYLQNRGVVQIAITKGAEPVRFVSGASSGLVPVPQVDAVDTMGAGDIFHGAYCYYAATGCGFEEALKEAARVAAESCRFHGTREWISHRRV
jgi:sugar/nucleoside kinase (ribokinase family)